MTIFSLRRWFPGITRESRGSPPDTRLRYNRYLGFHADEDNGLEDPRLVSEVVRRCNVKPPDEIAGAMALWRHLITPNYEDMKPQRARAAQYAAESPTIILVPFTTQDPGSDDAVTRAAQQALILANLPATLALYGSENPIFGFGNLNSDNYMPNSTAAARNAAWWAFEAEAFAIIASEPNIATQGTGYRWCATDDQGLSSLCQTVVARRAAWALEGLNPDDCQFMCAHSYVVSGFVPAHLLLAERSFTRAGVTTPIRHSELAFDFVRAGETDADRPWIFTDDDPTFPQGLTWFRLLCEWFGTNRKIMLPFDWTVFVRNLDLSSLGIIFTDYQRTQPTFVEPAAGSLWFHPTNAPTRAYALALSNSGTVADAQAAYDSVAAGNLFTIPALVAPGEILLESGDNILLESGDLILME